MLSANSPEIQRFLTAWHELGRDDFEPPTLADTYDTWEPKRAVQRKRWICLDRGLGSGAWSGVYLADRETGEVYTIKGYGRPNRKIGTLAELTAMFSTRSAPNP